MFSSKNIILYRYITQVNIGIPLSLESEYILYLLKLCQDFCGHYQQNGYDGTGRIEIIRDVYYSFHTFNFDCEEAASCFYQSVLLD